jgi:hypothetical protein
LPENFDWERAIYNSFAIFREGSQGPQQATLLKLEGYADTKAEYVASLGCGVS